MVLGPGVFLNHSQIEDIIPMTKAIPAITPRKATQPQASKSGKIQFAIDNAATRTTHVPHDLKENSDTVI